MLYIHTSCYNIHTSCCTCNIHHVVHVIYIHVHHVIIYIQSSCCNIHTSCCTCNIHHVVRVIYIHVHHVIIYIHHVVIYIHHVVTFAVLVSIHHFVQPPSHFYDHCRIMIIWMIQNPVLLRK